MCVFLLDDGRGNGFILCWIRRKPSSQLLSFSTFLFTFTQRIKIMKIYNELNFSLKGMGYLNVALYIWIFRHDLIRIGLRGDGKQLVASDETIVNHTVLPWELSSGSQLDTCVELVVSTAQLRDGPCDTPLYAACEFPLMGRWCVLVRI